ncbi:hypothetical protein J6590_078048 [Homalodisca vitripennis]|nr:hypothetical protein J6590_078048 [Homalodisca vitripennis]
MSFQANSLEVKTLAFRLHFKYREVDLWRTLASVLTTPYPRGLILTLKEPCQLGS